MEFDLRTHLRDLGAAPSLPSDAVPAGAVLARVRRGRAVRTVGVGVVSAAAVLAVGAVVYAAPWDQPTPPPADSPRPTTQSPAPTSTQMPSPEPTSAPTPTVPPEQAAGPSPIALTASGELVELDARTGAVLRRIAADAAWAEPLAVDRERGHVYVAKVVMPGEPEWPGGSTVQRVSIAESTVVDVAEGRSPALSPDGRRLAFVSQATTPDPWDEDHALIQVNAVTTLDLTDGSTRSVVDPWGSQDSRAVGDPVWSADGARIYVQTGWVDAPFGAQVLVIDPATDTVLDEASMAVTTQDALQEWSRPVVLPDGRLAVTVSARGPDVGTDPGDPHSWETGAPDSVDEFAAVVNPANGSVIDRPEVPGFDVDLILAAAPDGGLAFVDFQHTADASSHVLYLVGPDGVVEIGRWDWSPERETKEGIVAIAW